MPLHVAVQLPQIPAEAGEGPYPTILGEACCQHTLDLEREGSICLLHHPTQHTVLYLESGRE